MNEWFIIYEYTDIVEYWQIINYYVLWPIYICYGNSDELATAVILKAYAPIHDPVIVFAIVKISCLCLFNGFCYQWQSMHVIYPDVTDYCCVSLMNNYKNLTTFSFEWIKINIKNGIWQCERDISDIPLTAKLIHLCIIARTWFHPWHTQISKLQWLQYIKFIMSN